MKQTKRLIALVLAVVTLASFAITTASATPPTDDYVGNFTDVPKAAWYAKAVKWAVDWNITYGRTDTLFCPNENVNFMETCAFLYRVFDSPSITQREILQQLDRLPQAVRNKLQSWSHKFVAWALRDGIVNVYELTDKTDTTGKLIVPNQALSRNYVIAFLYRAQRTMKGSAKNGLLISPKFEDFKDRADANLVKGGDGANAWKWAISNGMIAGRSTTKLACKGTVKRSEIVTILYRYRVTQAYVSLALQQDGKSYVNGGRGPNSFDCSGLIYYVMTTNSLATGSTLGGSCNAQVSSSYTTYVTKSTEANAMSKLHYGDLIYYKRSSTGDYKHVAIYLGQIDMSNVATNEKDAKDTVAVFHARTPSRRVGISGFLYDTKSYYPYWEAYSFNPCP